MTHEVDPLLFARKSEVLRFWSKVNMEGDCWVWTAGAKRYFDGEFYYGQFRLRGNKVASAHRISYTNLKSEIPSDMYVDHICHNTLCVKPDHLRLATPKQNGENRKGAPSNSTSGVRGVMWRGDRNKWRVAVVHNGKTYYGGHFASLEDAEKAAVAKRAELFTHAEQKEGL